MEAVEIIMLICGIAFLILSFFVGNEKMSQHQVNTDADLFSAEKISEIKRDMESSIEESADNLVEDAKNKLASASNETIISIDDFSRQTLERINHNHEEVVFMYNMLQNKEEELKKSLADVQQTIRDLDKKKEEVKTEVFTPTLPMESGIEIARKKAMAKTVAEKAESSQIIEKKTTRNATKKITKETSASVKEKPTPVVLENMVESNIITDDNKNAKILEMYRNRKSVLEISKALGLGQGEVKLVIDLYGKN